MKTKGMNLAWVVVTNFEEGIKFYTDILGLKLHSKSDEFKWAELQGEDGAMVGITEYSEFSPVAPGGNAVLTYTVENIEQSIEEFKAKNIDLVGELQVIPEHVKLQLFKDKDGNFGQLVQLLE